MLNGRMDDCNFHRFGYRRTGIWKTEKNGMTGRDKKMFKSAEA